jgi:hypothetical protein
MLCDVVLALIVTYSDGHVEKLQRQGAPISAVQQAQDQVAKLKASPEFQAEMIKEGVANVELEVKKMPKPFDCSQDPEKAPEGK